MLGALRWPSRRRAPQQMEQMLPPTPARLCTLTRVDAARSGSSFEPPEQPLGGEPPAAPLWSPRLAGEQRPLVPLGPSALGTVTAAEGWGGRTGACRCGCRCGRGGHGALQRCPPHRSAEAVSPGAGLGQPRGAAAPAAAGRRSAEGGAAPA